MVLDMHPHHMLTRCTSLGSIVLGIAFMCGTHSTAVADTVVGGTIGEDTRWTIEGSPYIVQEDVIVLDGATVTIDPRVDVRRIHFDRWNLVR